MEVVADDSVLPFVLPIARLGQKRPSHHSRRCLVRLGICRVDYGALCGVLDWLSNREESVCGRSGIELDAEPLMTVRVV